jgi:hypothetical protein
MKLLQRGIQFKYFSNKNLLGVKKWNLLFGIKHDTHSKLDDF